MATAAFSKERFSVETVMKVRRAVCYGRRRNAREARRPAMVQSDDMENT
jgi:hypothetical protein